MDSIIYASATALARAIQRKEVSALEVVEAYLDRIEAVNPRLNAVVTLTAERARAEAREADASLARGELRGPLHGVPMTLKDNLDTAGVISTGGTQGRAAYIPQHDATVVKRMRSAGAILLGKTNTPELTLSFETYNLLFGRTNNPYDLTRSSGGSSGGAAAIIAAGGSPLDLGSDTGGSIRVPSHMCGTAGIRPTSGRVPRTGHIIPPGGMLDAFTQIGPMARFVEDLVTTLPIIAGVDWRDPAIVPMPLGDPGAVDLKALRIAVFTDSGIRTPTPDIVETVRRAAAALSDLGMDVREDRPAVLAQTNELYGALADADWGWSINALLDEYGTTEPEPRLAKWVAELCAHPKSAQEISAVLIRWDQYRGEMLAFMEKYDAIVCPPCAFVAQPHGESELPTTGSGAFMYTEAFNLTGWPGAVVRCGASAEGMPIGVQVVARPWREDVALAIAAFLEKSFGGWQRPAF